jgi:hypothetical protein
MPKSNIQYLREIQDVVDEINRKKQEVENLLQIIDALEIKMFNLREEAKQNNTTNAT